jgi:hypothetical protein
MIHTGFLPTFYLLFTYFTSVVTYFSYLFWDGILNEKEQVDLPLITGFIQPIAKKPVKPVVNLLNPVKTRLKVGCKVGNIKMDEKMKTENKKYIRGEIK